MNQEQDYKVEITIEADQKCLKVRSKARDGSSTNDVVSAVNSAIEGYLYTVKKLQDMSYTVAPLETKI